MLPELHFQNNKKHRIVYNVKVQYYGTVFEQKHSHQIHFIKYTISNCMKHDYVIAIHQHCLSYVCTYSIYLSLALALLHVKTFSTSYFVKPQACCILEVGCGVQIAREKVTVIVPCSEHIIWFVNYTALKLKFI